MFQDHRNAAPSPFNKEPRPLFLSHPPLLIHRLSFLDWREGNLPVAADRDTINVFDDGCIGRVIMPQLAASTCLFGHCRVADQTPIRLLVAGCMRVPINRFTARHRRLAEADFQRRLHRQARSLQERAGLSILS